MDADEYTDEVPCIADVGKVCITTGALGMAIMTIVPVTGPKEHDYIAADGYWPSSEDVHVADDKPSRTMCVECCEHKITYFGCTDAAGGGVAARSCASVCASEVVKVDYGEVTDLPAVSEYGSSDGTASDHGCWPSV